MRCSNLVLMLLFTTAAAGEVEVRLAAERSLLAAGRAEKLVLRATVAPAPPAAPRFPAHLAVVIAGTLPGALAPALDQWRADQAAATARTILAPDLRSPSLLAGISLGAATLRHQGEGLRHLLVVSADKARNEPFTVAEYERLGVSLRKEGISLAALDCGGGASAELLTRLAEGTGGRAWYTPSPETFATALAAEAAALPRVAAVGAALHLTCAPGVRPLRLLGRGGRQRADRYDVDLEALVGGQEEHVLVEVFIAPTAAGGNRPVATATLTWAEGPAEPPAAVTLTLAASADAAAVAASADPAVQVAIGETEAAVALDLCLDLMAQQRPAEALANLYANASGLRARAKTYANAALLEQAVQLESRAAELEAQGLDEAQQREMRTENYQLRTQQMGF